VKRMAGKRGQNEGTIRQRKDGTWEARYSLGRDKDGRQIQKSIYDKERNVVAKKLNLALSLINSGENIKESKATLYSWMMEWLDTYKKPNCAETSYESHRCIVRNCIKGKPLGNMQLNKIKKHHIQDALNGLQNTPSMAKKAYILLKESLNEAVENKMIKENPIGKMKAPKVEQAQVQILTLEEQDKFIRALDGNKFQVILMLALQTGLRIGELCGLKWSDLDLERKTITVKRRVKRTKVIFDDKSKGNKTEILIRPPKTAKSRRTIPLMESAVIALQQHKKEQKILEMKHKLVWRNEKWIFTLLDGKLLEPNLLDRQFKAVLKTAGLPSINFHALRHTFVSRLLEAGENIKTISELIGHTDVAFTLNKYAHILPEQKQSAVDSIDKLFSIKK
jgi:integrase